MEVSRYPFAVMRNSHLFLSRDVKSLPAHQVRAIGWKLDGSSAASLAAALGTNLMTPRFQLLATSPHCQYVSKRSTRAVVKDG